MIPSARLSALIAATLVALGCAALGGALLLGWIVIDRQTPPHQRALAVVVDGRIEPGEWTWGKLPRQGADRHLLAVTFPVDGATQAGELQVPKAVFDTQPVGSTLAVWYSPERPDLVVLSAPQGAATRSRFGLLLGWLFLGLGTAGAVVLGNRLHVARGGQSLL